MSWNILSDGNLYYNWRKSYGLYYPEEFNKSKMSDIYDEQKLLFSKFEIKRLNNIISQIKKYKPDILLLQEIPDDRKDYLDNHTVSEYIANKLLYTIVNTSFKNDSSNKKKLFRWNYPPFEMNFRKQFNYLNSGVCTLVKNNRKFRVEYLCRSENFGYSSLFSNSFGSPMTVDKIYFNNKYIILVNIHIVMNFPNINLALQELKSRITNTYHALKIDSQEGFSNTVIMGDFNCSNETSFYDLNNSSILDYLINISKNKTNNKILIGKSIKTKFIKDIETIKVLQMNINTNIEDKIRWTNWWDNIKKRKNTIDFTINKKKYSSYVSNENNDLIFKNFEITSDQIPILLNLE